MIVFLLFTLKAFVFSVAIALSWSSIAKLVLNSIKVLKDKTSESYIKLEVWEPAFTWGLYYLISHYI
jgi:hypothetical protein